MNKLISKIAALTMTACMMVGMSACANSGETSSTSSTDTSSTVSDTATKKKVAVILQGPITDMAWNQTAYNGVKKIEEMGAEISYQENVEVSSLADSINTYANANYDLVFLATNTYENAAKTIVGNYPNTQFVLINGAENYTDNMVSYQIADDEQGFLQGAIAALTTKTKNVGFVGGSAISAIVNGKKGFLEGVKYIDPSVKATATLTGNMDNVNQAKETAKAMIDAGADSVSPMCNQSSIGVLQAAEESGKSNVICSSTNQQDSAPNAAIIGIGKDTSIAYVEIYKRYLAGKLDTDKVTKMGAAEGVVFLTDWYDGAKDIDQETKDKVQAVYDDLAAGKITINLDD